METVLLEQLAVSLGLGLLVGFQREWSPGKKEAGIRTFALITLFGTLTARLSLEFGGWMIAAGLLSLGAITLTARYQRITYSPNARDFGVTTEVAALVMYGVGAVLVIESMSLGVIIGGIVTVLLQWKSTLHNLVRRIGEQDIRAIIQLILIWLIILPVLPNRSLGPYQVLNPHEIWLMVVLIVGLSLGGYIAYKFFGAKTGTLLAGIFGGLVSSTATTVTFSKHSRARSGPCSTCSTVIMIASTIVFVRVVIEIGIVAPDVLPTVIAPIAALVAVMVLIAVWLLAQSRRETETVTAVEGNPAELKTAVIFGLLYAVVLLGVAAAKAHLGNKGLYIVSAISGLTDADAITLSTAKMINAGRVTVDTGWRMIMLGTLCNIVFKGGIVAVVGSPRLFRRIAAAFGIALLAGALILLFWPPVA
ncbi:MgtC/SapB family protein [bacterium]|nr:MgtC/SapB family protein [bacterium]